MTSICVLCEVAVLTVSVLMWSWGWGRTLHINQSEPKRGSEEEARRERGEKRGEEGRRGEKRGEEGRRGEKRGGREVLGYNFWEGGTVTIEHFVPNQKK